MNSSALPSLAPSSPARSSTSRAPFGARTYLSASLTVGAVGLAAAGLTFRAGWGVNVVLLVALAVGVVLWRRPTAWRYASVRVQVAALVALAVASFVHLDPWTTTSLLVAATVLLGGLWFAPGTDPFRALCLGLLQVLAVPAAWWRSLRGLAPASAALFVPDRRSVGRVAGSVGVVAVFGGLYVASNASLTTLWARTGEWLAASALLGDVFAFWLWAALWTVPAAALVYVWRPVRRVVARRVAPYPDAGRADPAAAWSRASVTLLLVNVMALVVNTLDGASTWLGEVSRAPAELTRGVHAGTYTLVVAIVLAAGYLIAMARRPPVDRARAEALALAWLGQNLAMAMTVALRNAHYTEAFGLTYRRIGVWTFLLCAAAGLVLLAREVRQRRGLEDLVRRQAWAVYAVLALVALPNWPGLITRYNLAEGRLDHDRAYLRSLRPYNLDVWMDLEPISSDPARPDLVPSDAPPQWTGLDGDWRAFDLGQWRRAARSAER